MDAILKKTDLALPESADLLAVRRPSREEAEEAVRTLIAWAGDDPSREGLLDTPKRVTKAYNEFFKGYEEDPVAVLARTFEEDAGYDDLVMLRDIDMNSHCEHHMVPIIGKAHVAYWPNAQVVGISKLARIVDIYAKRLVSQETMTKQIVQTIDSALKPKGAAVMIDAGHQCMSTRGVHKHGVDTITTRFTGSFEDQAWQSRFTDLVRQR